MLSAAAVDGGGRGKRCVAVKRASARRRELADRDHDLSIWLDERVFPTYAAAASILVLALRAVWNTQALRKRASNATNGSTYAQTRSASFLDRVGGPTIFFFKIARLLGTLALFGLTLLTAVHGGWKWVDVTAVATLVRLEVNICALRDSAMHVQAYGSLLALVNTFSSARGSLTISGHLSTVTFPILAVYMYRDIWPLMTFTLAPKDEAEGRVLWAKVALAAFVGAVEPIFEPYPYIPYDPAVSIFNEATHSSGQLISIFI